MKVTSKETCISPSPTMSNGTEILKNTRTRLKNYPSFLLQCQESAAAYANCVLEKVSLEKNNCKLEFDNFKKCLRKAAQRKL